MLLQNTTSTDTGPPMLTKETNPPMPNLGPPNISGPPQLMAPSLPQKPPGLLPPSAVPVPFTAPSQVKAWNMF